MKTYYVYIVKCADQSYYTGITNNLKERLKLHQRGKAARYTSQRLPVKIVYCRKGYSQREARQEEIILKDWSREKKEKLINGIIER